MLHKVSTLDVLWEGERITVQIEGIQILLAHLEGQVHAYEDRCPHQGYPLSQGEFFSTRLRCAAHHWEFDVLTGQGLNPKTACLRRFPVTVEGRDILVDV